MEKTIIVGKEGEQNFEITGTMVSRKHAQVSVDDNGTWMLQDLGSANGTYVRDANGNFVKVDKVTITPDTFICLGASNAQGCMFYACHLFNAQDDFYHEFQLLANYSKRFGLEYAKAEKQATYIMKGIACVSLLMLGLSFAVEQSKAIMLLRVGTALSTLYSLFANPKKKLMEISERAGNFYRCPNPGCYYQLSAKDIANCQCPRCRAHA